MKRKSGNSSKGCLKVNWVTMPEDIEFFEFPDPRSANREGVVAVGGLVNPGWVYSAYQQGIFPWPIEFEEEMVTAWCSPDPRAVFQWEDLHLPRRLRRKLRAGRFRVTSDQAFDAVINACSGPRMIDGVEEIGTWITSEMMAAYKRLHTMGKVHSVEVWLDDQLVGGLYGVAFGGIFAGESMFRRVSDASKIGLCVLLKHLHTQGFALMDIQQMTSHCAALGAKMVNRDYYLGILERTLMAPVEFGVVDSESYSW